MNASSSEVLILELHGRLLRTFAVEAGQHFQGLAQAARFLKRSGRISAATANKLLKLDFAFNLVRHITTISVCRFEEDLVSELRSTLPKAPRESINHTLDTGRFGKLSDFKVAEQFRESLNHALATGRFGTITDFRVVEQSGTKFRKISTGSMQ